MNSLREKIEKAMVDDGIAKNDPKIQGGQACINGTRIQVEVILTRYILPLIKDHLLKVGPKDLNTAKTNEEYYDRNHGAYNRAIEKWRECIEKELK